MSLPVLSIGVLALQGSFAEHVHLLTALKPLFPSHELEILEIRTTVHLAQVQALIIPGGESTAISLIAHRTNLLEPLRAFVKEAKEGRKAVWGTCAGMILLGEEVVGGKEGADGFAMGNGMDVKVVRNQWGRQSESFTHPLEINCLSNPSVPFSGIFIRAPVLHSLLPVSPNSPPLEILARVPRAILPVPKLTGDKLLLPTNGNMTTASELGPDADIVMVKQGSLVVSSFHPELTGDARVHEWFIREVVLVK